MSNPNPPTILSTLGEEIIRIITPVSLCMLLVVVLVSSLSPSDSPGTLTSIATLAYSEAPSDSLWDKLEGTLLNSLVFVAVLTVLTFALVLLFYLRCTACLKSYMAFSSFVVLALLGGELSVLLLRRFALPLDAPTFFILLVNFSVVGVMSVFLVKMPISVVQGYLVVIGVLVAYCFTMLPEWTTWGLLVSMALYDLAAVLLPGGPLRLLVELAMARDEEIPALVYEARPVEPPPSSMTRVWRENANSSNSESLTEPRVVSAEEESASSREARVVIAEEQSDELRASSREARVVIAEEQSDELRAPLVRRGMDRGGEDDFDGIGLGASGAIKLGLGDFIFYSVLVGRAALYDYMTVYACYLAIVAGLGITLLLLAFYRKALPALPVSIMFGILFYLLTRTLLEVFIVQCSTNLLMF